MFLPKNLWKQNTNSRRSNTIIKSHYKIICITLVAILLVFFAFLVTPLLSNSPKIVAAAEPTAILLQEPSTQSEPQFNVTLMYAYTGPNNYYGKALNSTFMGMPMHPASLYPDIIYLNFTLISNATNEIYDAKIEVYQIQISANTGLMERYICFFGTNYNTSYSNPNFLTPSISYIDQLVDTSNARITGIFSPNMLTGQSLWFKVGSLDTTTSKSNGLGLWSAGEPNSITVSIQRIGWIALNGTSSSIISPSPLDSVQAQISLPKLDEGFQFNAITQNEMSKDADVFHPIDLYNLTP